jgi:hypothetical protein
VARIEGLELPLGWRRATRNPKEWSEKLEANLAEIAALARDAEISIVLLTYAANRGSVYGEAINAHIRAAAEATNTPLIDVGHAMEAICPPPCPALFFRDDHPTARGYTRVAEVVVEGLRTQPALLPR